MRYKIQYHPTLKDFEDAYIIEKNYLEPSTISSVQQVTCWNNKNNIYLCAVQG